MRPPDVDLVILNEAPPVLRYEVLAAGRCLFARSEAGQAEWRTLVARERRIARDILSEGIAL